MKGDLLSKLTEALKDMEKRGVGRSNPENVQFGSPGFFVKRPRTTKLRLCVSYKLLNSVTKDDIFPLPRIGIFSIGWEIRGILLFWIYYRVTGKS